MAWTVGVGAGAETCMAGGAALALPELGFACADGADPEAPSVVGTEREACDPLADVGAVALVATAAAPGIAAAREAPLTCGFGTTSTCCG